MSDDDVTMDSMDEEELFTPRSPNKRFGTFRTLRSHSGLNHDIDGSNLSVRRSTRNRMQTYDNLNTSWILGTQTLKGYPMLGMPQHGSSSDKEIADEVSKRKRFSKSRMPLRSRENHPPNKGSPRHMRDRTEHSRQTNHERELRDKSDRNQDHREREERDKESRDGKDPRIKLEKMSNDEKESRSREGPVTRLGGSLLEKSNAKQGEESNAESSRESDKVENNDNSDNEEEEDEEEEEDGYQDMYSRVKRTRKTSQRQLSRSKKMSDSDASESSDAPGLRKYSLRQKKPTIDRFQATVEPVRRSIRALRSVLTNSMRRRKHRSKSTSSSDLSDSEAQRYDKKKIKKSRQPTIPKGSVDQTKADINPITLDTNIRFNDVGGLESHIHCLKEMVVFPLLYPDVFDRFHITPPKGVLFHGPPGTGKTLIARALANECSENRKKVSFFMRKGADCLSKWVGESERQLRLLFEQAQQMKPSIIFFDEIDGLAPVRSTKQDQIHASIVSTLLALMDGLNDRGEVIVIGATNRIDAIDPALRRPGRFDRELFFPLPSSKERLEILKIHVSKWKNQPSDQLLQVLAERAIGYCGSDLRALCTEAVIQGLRRTYPQIYLTSNRLLLDPERVQVKKQDFLQASSLLVPSSHRVTPCIGRRLQSFTEPLLGPSLKEVVHIVTGIFPQGISAAMAKVKVTKGIYRPRLLMTGGKMAQRQGPNLAQALIHEMEHLPVHTLDVSTLFAESARSPEETCVQIFNEASRNVPSIIYIRSVDQWWSLVPETVKAVFLCRIEALDPPLPILILATCESDYHDLPSQLKQLFSEFRGEVFTINRSNKEQRFQFFKPIFLVQSLKSPSIKKTSVQVLEELPLAPDPEPKKLTDEEKKIIVEKEEISLRELRIFLREICAKLARNRQFFMFTKPVDTEEVPDYNSIIKRPMDLETMMSKIDMHSYLCAGDFLDDIDLICRNALEYNPERDPADKLIRHRACSLRDNAYALIKAELDSDFEGKCREISKSRKNSVKKTQSKQEVEDGADSNRSPVVVLNEKSEKKNVGNMALVMNGKKFSNSRKRRIPAWARGYVKRSHKKKKIAFDDSVNSVNEKSPQSNSNSLVTINLQQFEEFENSMVNGHLAETFENSETDAIDAENLKDKSPDDQNDGEKQSQGQQSEQKKLQMPSQGNSNEIGQEENVEKKSKENKCINSNSSSSNSSRSNSKMNSLILNDGLDDTVMVTNDSDSSPTKPQETDVKLSIDKNELEEAFEETVQATENYSIEELCDVYVQLNKCTGKYATSYDRKSLPKDLLKELKRFEDCRKAMSSNIEEKLSSSDQFDELL